jgi:hypothetical protein
LANGRRPKETKHKPRKSSPGDSFFMYASGKNQYIDKSENALLKDYIQSVGKKG